MGVVEEKEEQKNNNSNQSGINETIRRRTTTTVTAAATDDNDKLENDKLLRKRLKKLRKRAYNNQKQHSNYSGILTQEEYEELKTLNYQMTQSNKVPGSCLFININKGNPDRVGWKKCDGVDIRDMILNVLLYSEKGGKGVDSTNKRKHDEIVLSDADGNSIGDRSMMLDKISIPSMPNWARIHNPACISSLAVIEFSIECDLETCGEDYTPLFMPSSNNSSSSDDKNDNLPTITSLLSAPEGIHKRKATPMQVRLFQGYNTAQQMSDVFLYFDRKKQFIKTPNANADDLSKTSSSVYPLLQPLILSNGQLVNDNFPLCSNANDGDDCIEIKQTLLDSNLPSFPITITSSTEFPFNADKSQEMMQSLSQLPDNNYNEHNNTGPSSSILSFIPTFRNHNTDTQPQVYAIDCEMVLTSEGHSLARVTVIQSSPSPSNINQYNLIMDTLVQPPVPVIDYLTTFSGITKRSLQHVHITLEQVQTILLNLICKEDILVGHSIENDLLSLRLSHSNIVDTAILFQSTSSSSNFGGRKYSLRHLSSVLLKKNIQTQSTGIGHCSLEDASTSLTLAIQKAVIGTSFSIHDQYKNRINLFHVLSNITNTNRTHQNYDCTLTSSQNNSKMVCIGPDQWINRHINTSSDSSSHILNCESITDTTKTNAISSFLQTNNDKKLPASFVYTNLTVSVTPTNYKQMLTHMDEVILNTIQKISYNIPILLVFQRLHQLSDKITAQKKIRCKHPEKSTLGAWNESMEKKRCEILDCSRSCEALFVGMAL